MQQLAEGIYVETSYEGVNVGAIVTRRGIICIDAPSYPKDARHWAMRLRQISPLPIQFAILLDWHGDRVLNTRWLNARLIAHQKTRDRLISYDKRYPQSVIDSLTARNPHLGKELSSSPVEKPDISFTNSMSLIKGKTELVLLHAPGPADGSIWVHLPKAGILFTGDGIVADTPPPLIAANVDHWLHSLAYLEKTLDKVHTIVPGRGSIGDPTLVRTMTAFLEKLREKARLKYEEKWSRDELETHIDELIQFFPNSSLPQDWLQQQIRLGLDHIHDEIESKVTVVADPLPQ